MNLYKIIWKVPITTPEVATPETFFRVFNTWINPTSPEVFVDVADYSHVYQGPITVLVGYYVDYVLDNAGSVLGLAYRRKQPFASQVKNVYQQTLLEALKACERLTQDQAFAGKLSFDVNAMTLIHNDRALAPNNPKTFKRVLSELNFLPATHFTKTQLSNDKRQRLTHVIQTKSSFDLARMLQLVAER